MKVELLNIFGEKRSMKKLRKISSACCLAVSFTSGALAESRATPLLVVTGDFPEHTISADGSVGGTLKPQVKRLLKGIERPIKFLSQPWARAQRSARSAGLVFPLARTPEREHWYHWVGPIGQDRWVFAIRKSDVASFDFPKDLEGARLGVTRGSSMHSRLLQKKFRNIQVNTREYQNFEMLIKGRIDVWYTTENVFKGMLASRRHQDSDVEIVRYDEQFDIYIGVSRQLDSSLLSHLQSEFLPFQQAPVHTSQCPELRF